MCQWLYCILQPGCLTDLKSARTVSNRFYAQRLFSSISIYKSNCCSLETMAQSHFSKCKLTHFFSSNKLKTLHFCGNIFKWDSNDVNGAMLLKNWSKNCKNSSKRILFISLHTSFLSSFVIPFFIASTWMTKGFLQIQACLQGSVKRCQNIISSGKCAKLPVQALCQLLRQRTLSSCLPLFSSCSRKKAKVPLTISK